MILKDILLKLFTAMFNFSHTPTSMKRGIIITLYKGGNEKKNDPNSYRAITRSSVILKLYEKVILTLCKEDGKAELNKLQTGFQPNMGCMMTAFMVRESIHFMAEFGSKLYMCFLDTRFYILFVVTAAGVVLCGSPKKQPRTSSIVQFIFFFLVL